MVGLFLVSGVPGAFCCASLRGGGRGRAGVAAIGLGDFGRGDFGGGGRLPSTTWARRRLVGLSEPPRLLLARGLVVVGVGCGVTGAGIVRISIKKRDLKKRVSFFCPVPPA